MKVGNSKWAASTKEDRCTRLKPDPIQSGIIRSVVTSNGKTVGKI